MLVSQQRSKPERNMSFGFNRHCRLRAVCLFHKRPGAGWEKMMLRISHGHGQRSAVGRNQMPWSHGIVYNGLRLRCTISDENEKYKVLSYK